MGYMRVLITGAAGFIGSHLTDRFLLAGDSVIGLDNLSTGDLINLENAMLNPNFTFVEWDVTSPYNFDVDLILNFACPASPVHYQRTPIQTLLTSLIGTVNALDLALKSNAVLVHASTSEVYGDPEISPQPESYLGKVNPIGPRACYDEGKRAAETAIYDYIRVHNIDARVVRIFNTYGPRMAVNDGRVVSNFIVSALTNAPISIYGDGSQSRSFCYVDDTVEAIIRMSKLENCPNSPVNIGNPNEISMMTLSSHVRKICNSQSTLVSLPLPIDDPKQRCPEISLAKNLLGWSPSIDLEVGLKKTSEYFISVL
jgi:UDP-glucuronate decarboxylase